MNIKLSTLGKSVSYVVIALLLMQLAKIIASYTVGFALGTVLIALTPEPHAYPIIAEAVVAFLLQIIGAFVLLAGLEKFKFGNMLDKYELRLTIRNAKLFAVGLGFALSALVIFYFLDILIQSVCAIKLHIDWLHGMGKADNRGDTIAGMAIQNALPALVSVMYFGTYLLYRLRKTYSIPSSTCIYGVIVTVIFLFINCEVYLGSLYTLHINVFLIMAVLKVFLTGVLTAYLIIDTRSPYMAFGCIALVAFGSAYLGKVLGGGWFGADVINLARIYVVSGLATMVLANVGWLLLRNRLLKSVRNK